MRKAGATRLWVRSQVSEPCKRSYRSFRPSLPFFRSLKPLLAGLCFSIFLNTCGGKEFPVRTRQEICHSKTCYTEVVCSKNDRSSKIEKARETAENGDGWMKNQDFRTAFSFYLDAAVSASGCDAALLQELEFKAFRAFYSMLAKEQYKFAVIAAGRFGEYYYKIKGGAEYYKGLEYLLIAQDLLKRYNVKPAYNEKTEFGLFYAGMVKAFSCLHNNTGAEDIEHAALKIAEELIASGSEENMPTIISMLTLLAQAKKNFGDADAAKSYYERAWDLHISMQKTLKPNDFDILKEAVLTACCAGDKKEVDRIEKKVGKLAKDRKNDFRGDLSEFINYKSAYEKERDGIGCK